MAMSSFSRDFFITLRRLLNLSTSCLTNVVKLGSKVPSSVGSKCYFRTLILIGDGRLLRFAITASTCSSGVTSEDPEVTGCKPKMVLMILLDYWFMKIMLALG